MIDIGFLRLLRTVRLIKVMRRIRSIRIILWTFLQSLKALPYVALLMGMAYFVYAVIGMQLFGNILPTPDSALHEYANFGTFFQTLLLLFRMTTGEGWPDVMMSCTSDKPCQPLADSQLCGSSFAAYFYFVSFVLVSTFLLLNLLVAVILDNFEFLTRDSSILGPHHLDEFIQNWSEFDPNGSGFIHYKDLFQLVKAMEPPLGFGVNCPLKTAYRKLIRMNVPITKGKSVNFTTTLFALIRESLKIRIGEAKDMDRLDEELKTIITKHWPKASKRKMKLLIPPHDATGFGQLTTGKIYAGLLFLELWKNSTMKSRIDNKSGERRHRYSKYSESGTLKRPTSKLGNLSNVSTPTTQASQASPSTPSWIVMKPSWNGTPTDGDEVFENVAQVEVVDIEKPSTSTFQSQGANGNTFTKSKPKALPELPVRLAPNVKHSWDNAMNPLDLRMTRLKSPPQLPFV